MKKFVFGLVFSVLVSSGFALTSDQVFAYLVDRGQNPYYLHSVGLFELYMGDDGVRVVAWRVPGVAQPTAEDFLPEADAAARVLRYKLERARK